MRYLFCLLSVALLSLNGCRTGPQTELPFQTFVTIPAGLNVGLSHNFNIFDIEGIPNTEILKANPAYVRLVVEYGELNTDFIQQAFLYTAKDSTIQEIAYQTQLPINNAQFAELYPSLADVKEHITQPRFNLRLKLIFRSIPVTETRLRIDFGFLADVGE